MSCSTCWKTQKQLARAERALRDLATEQGDSSMADMILAQRGWVENANTERDRWRKLAQVAMASIDKAEGDVKAAWKQLGEQGYLEVVRCVECAARIGGDE